MPHRQTVRLDNALLVGLSLTTGVFVVSWSALKNWEIYNYSTRNTSLEVAPTFVADSELLIYSFQFRCAFQLRSASTVTVFPQFHFLFSIEKDHCDLELWPVTLTLKFDQRNVKMNQHAKYLGRNKGHSVRIYLPRIHTAELRGH